MLALLQMSSHHNACPNTSPCDDRVAQPQLVAGDLAAVAPSTQHDNSNHSERLQAIWKQLSALLRDMDVVYNAVHLEGLLSERVLTDVLPEPAATADGPSAPHVQGQPSSLQDWVDAGLCTGMERFLSKPLLVSCVASACGIPD